MPSGCFRCDVGIEFSSAGFRKPVDDTYPSASLLDALLAVGTNLTTASDAHSLDQVGLGFDHLVAALDARGISELTTFDRHRRGVHHR